MTDNITDDNKNNKIADTTKGKQGKYFFPFLFSISIFQKQKIEMKINQ